LRVRLVELLDGEAGMDENEVPTPTPSTIIRLASRLTPSISQTAVSLSMLTTRMGTPKHIWQTS
jgi:hypothetical protein